ncbi:DgyrCDS12769 [Dimorphilus gyrociliatus]|uniref:DgyrCDS12769 n=1 Tax=Dimorphilus gyrociliatus TaxID=2664684 RepID=A0A7I8W8N9_9ANNE|nr:DgyrCDS12769 [Dimorphilus gyrociliatus]
MPIRRTIKNVVKNYSDAQVKVREATSNDPWNPSSTLMAGIADLTYNVVAFTEIMQIIWKRLNDHGKNWRHVYKSLVLLDYIVKTGSEKVAQQCRENIYVIQTLKDFQYMDDNRDQGASVREKAKQLVALLKDEERLKNERAKALKAKERFAQSAMGYGSNTTSPTVMHTSSSYGETFSPRPNVAASELDAARPSNSNEEELQLQLALAMSKEEAEEDERKRRGDDMKLHMAIEESKKEQESDQEQNDLVGLSLQQATATNDDDSVLSPQFRAYLQNPELEKGAAVPANDPWASGSKPTNGNKDDPWGSSSATSDPWGAPQQQQTDPWSSSKSPEKTGSNDPWGAPSQKESPWEDYSNLNKPGAANPLDDFDLIGNRSNTTTTTSVNIDNNTADAFNLTSLETNLPSKKTPENFLGEHSKLVNMDNLVSRPTPSPVNTNPFAALASGVPPTTNNPAARNPFAQQQAVPRIPMNQMARNSPTFQFGNEQQMPAPLVPLGGAGGAAANTNPFL